jgi:hypothetical protein
MGRMYVDFVYGNILCIIIVFDYMMYFMHDAIDAASAGDFRYPVPQAPNRTANRNPRLSHTRVSPVLARPAGRRQSSKCISIF